MQYRIYEDDVFMQQYLQLSFYCWLFVARYLFIVGYWLLVIFVNDAISQI